ncbi:MAG: hypothetical protein ACYCT9_11600 [Leptospirillum sp.]
MLGPKGKGGEGRSRTRGKTGEILYGLKTPQDRGIDRPERKGVSIRSPNVPNPGSFTTLPSRTV